MNKRSIAAIALIAVLAGGFVYYLDARYERQVAELRKQAATAEAAAKRAQQAVKQQSAAEVERAQLEVRKSKDIAPKKP